MKRLILGAMWLGCLVASCSSENKQKKMWDTSVAADSQIIDSAGPMTDTSKTINTGPKSMNTDSKSTNTGNKSMNADTVNRDQTIKADSVRQ